MRAIDTQIPVVQVSLESWVGYPDLGCNHAEATAGFRPDQSLILSMQNTLQAFHVGP